MIAPVPRALPITRGGRLLDPDQPATDDTRPTQDSPAADAGPAGSAVPGDGQTARPAAGPRPRPLRDQAGSTRDAAIALARAHIDLAKAEAAEIGDEIKVVAGGIGLAFAAAVLVAFLLPIGLILFFGEWLFGSMGWGVLLGTELLVLLGLGAVVAAFEAGRVGRAIGLGFLAGLVVAILFGTNAPNQLYTLIADQFPPVEDPGPIAIGIGAAIGAVVGALLGVIAGARSGTGGAALRGLIGGLLLGAATGALVGGIVRLAADEGSRPLVVGMVIVGAVVALVGLVLGARSDGLSGAFTGLVVGLAIGAAIGAFSAITFSWHVAIAIGIALFLGLAIGLIVSDVATRGVDVERLQARFIPQRTIDTTKESIEWAKARMPRGPRS